MPKCITHLQSNCFRSLNRLFCGILVAVVVLVAFKKANLHVTINRTDWTKKLSEWTKLGNRPIVTRKLAHAIEPRVVKEIGLCKLAFKFLINASLGLSVGRDSYFHHSNESSIARLIAIKVKILENEIQGSAFPKASSPNKFNIYCLATALVPDLGTLCADVSYFHTG